MNTINNIYCVGRNYVEHIKELNNIVPESPVIFNKPTNALIKANNNTIELPANKGTIHYEAELVIKLAKDYNPEESIDNLIHEMTVGLDLTLRDLQQNLKDKGYPWLLSKGFINSAILGEFIPFHNQKETKKKNFSLLVNNSRVQEGNISQMIFDLESLIHFVGSNLGLKKGDILFTGTPPGVNALHDDDKLELYWGTQKLGSCKVKIK